MNHPDMSDRLLFTPTVNLLARSSCLFEGGNQAELQFPDAFVPGSCNVRKI